MLADSRTIRCLNIPRKDLLPITLESDNPDCRSYEASELFAEAIVGGAAILDLATTDPAALTGAAYAGKDVVAAFSADTSASSYTISAASLSGVASFTIYGMNMDTNNRLTKFFANGQQIAITLSGNDFSKLRFKYCYYLNIIGSATTQMPLFQNSRVDIAGTVTHAVSAGTGPIFDTCAVTLTDNTTINVSSTEPLFDNCWVEGGGSTGATLNALSGIHATWRNTLTTLVINLSGAGSWTPTNCFHRSPKVMSPLIISNTLSASPTLGTMYVSYSEALSGTSFTQPIGWDIRYISQDYIPFDANILLLSGDYSTITGLSTSTSTFDAQVTQIRKTIRGTYGTIKRNYYNLQFQDNHVMDDSLKYFDDNDMILADRTDLLTSLVTGASAATFTNLIPVNAGNTEIDFRADESFLLLLTSAEHSAIIAYHKGEWMQTLLSDHFTDVEYTPAAAFQIWEMPEEVSYRNVWDIDNSPIDGSITVQDITSKVVI